MLDAEDMVNSVKPGGVVDIASVFELTPLSHPGFYLVTNPSSSETPS